MEDPISIDHGELREISRDHLALCDPDVVVRLYSLYSLTRRAQDAHPKGKGGKLRDVVCVRNCSGKGQRPGFKWFFANWNDLDLVVEPAVSERGASCKALFG